MESSFDPRYGVYVLKDSGGVTVGTYGTRKALSKGMAAFALGEPPCVGCGPVVKGGEKEGHKFRGNQFTGGINGPGQVAPSKGGKGAQAPVKSGGPTPPPRPGYIASALKAGVTAVSGKPKSGIAGESTAKPKPKGLSGIVGESKRQFKDGRPVLTQEQKNKRAVESARTKTKAREGVFGDEAVLPENATEAQKKEANRLRRAIIVGQQVEIGTGESILVVEGIKAWALEEKKKADEAKANGTEYKAKTINLCGMSLPGSNVFCSGNLGIERKDMPQFSSSYKPGSEAETYAKAHPEAVKTNKWGTELDASKPFEDALRAAFGEDAVTYDEMVPASSLRSTQSELDGTKVMGMAQVLVRGAAEDATPEEIADLAGAQSRSIYVSSDGRVLDGHHGFASHVAADVLNDGNLGDVDIRVTRINVPMADLIVFSQTWVEGFGLEPKVAGESEEFLAVAADKKKNPGLYKSDNFGNVVYSYSMDDFASKFKQAFVELRKERQGHKFRGNQYTHGINGPTHGMKRGRAGLVGRQEGDVNDAVFMTEDPSKPIGSVDRSAFYRQLGREKAARDKKQNAYSAKEKARRSALPDKGVAEHMDRIRRAGVVGEQRRTGNAAESDAMRNLFNAEQHAKDTDTPESWAAYDVALKDYAGKKAANLAREGQSVKARLTAGIVGESMPSTIRPKSTYVNGTITREYGGGLNTRKAGDTKPQIKNGLYRGADMSGENLSVSSILRTDFTTANLDEANFFNAEIRASTFIGASLVMAELGRASFDGVMAQGANFSMAALNSASLNHSDFSGANFTDADLSMAAIDGSRFLGANLEDTHISGNIDNSDFTGASFTGADLRGAKIDLSSTTLTGVTYDEYTIWPANFTTELLDSVGAVDGRSKARGGPGSFGSPLLPAYTANDPAGFNPHTQSRPQSAGITGRSEADTSGIVGESRGKLAAFNGTPSQVHQTMKEQIGSGAILAVSGGLVGIVDDNAIALPVSSGYYVEVRYDQGPDTYTVSRKMRRGLDVYDKGSVSGLYSDDLTEQVQQASFFRDNDYYGDTPPAPVPPKPRTGPSTVTLMRRRDKEVARIFHENTAAGMSPSEAVRAANDTVNADPRFPIPADFSIK